MTAIISKIISFIMAILAFFGLVKKPDIPVEAVEPGVYITEENKVKVVLEANPTTGYEWTYEVEKGEIAPAEESYVPDAVPEGVVGAGGSKIFVFTPAKEGEYRIVFSYARSFEEDSVIRTSAVEFRVDADLHAYPAN